MQVHGPSSSIDPKEDVSARLNGNFVVFAVGQVDIFVMTPEEADTLIAAAVEAKRLLSPPVITDSERDCDQANPVSGAWCHRSGEHTEHRDTDGETWPAGQGGVLFKVGDDDEALTAVAL